MSHATEISCEERLEKARTALGLKGKEEHIREVYWRAHDKMSHAPHKEDAQPVINAIALRISESGVTRSEPGSHPSPDSFTLGSMIERKIIDLEPEKTTTGFNPEQALQASKNNRLLNKNIHHIGSHDVTDIKVVTGTNIIDQVAAVCAVLTVMGEQRNMLHLVEDWLHRHKLHPHTNGLKHPSRPQDGDANTAIANDQRAPQ